MPVVLNGATVTSVNTEEETLGITRPGDEVLLTVRVSGATAITSNGGLPLELPAVAIGSQAEIQGELDVNTGVVTASVISIML